MPRNDPAGSLYYLAELVEEYSVLARKTIRVLTVVCSFCASACLLG